MGKSNKIFILVVSILISLISCESNHKSWEKEVKSVDDMFRIFNNEVKLNAETFIDDSLHLSNPFQIKILNDIILVQDIGNSPDGILSIFNMTNKQFIGKMFTYGNGSNEFLGLRMNPYGKDSLLALDPFKGKARLFGLNELRTCNAIPARIINYHSVSKGEQIDQSFLLGNKLVCSGQFQKGRFQVYDTKGNFDKDFDEFPTVDYGTNQLDNIQLGSLYSAAASFGTNSQNSMLACLTSSTLTFYDYNKDKNEFIMNFFGRWFIPKIIDASYMGGTPIVKGDNNINIVGAGNLVANDKYLFFPFSDLKIIDIINKGDDNRYKYIFVTNWEGEPVAKIILDKEIHFSLQIDKEGKYLYSLHTNVMNGFTHVIRYDISFLDSIKI